MTTREKLLRAARDEFAARGYQGSTTRTIAARAGVSEVTLFRHFPGKLGLFKAVLAAYSTLRLFTQEFKDELTWDLRTDLRKIADRFCAMLEHSTEAMVVSVSEAFRLPEVRTLVAEPPRRQRAFLAEYLTEQARRGNCRELTDPATAAQAFLAIFFELAISRRVYPDTEATGKPSAAQRMPVAEVVDLFIRGVGV